MASQPGRDETGRALDQLGSPKTVLLQTRKRDGTWVKTPVNLVIEGDHGYFRTYDASGKYKRLRNFPQVRLAASTLLGTPVGPAVEGRSRRLDRAEAEHAAGLLAARFPLLHGKIVPWMHRRKGWATVHYEVTFGT
jgi:PPOX class probable F420-dependent enzyme